MAVPGQFEVTEDAPPQVKQIHEHLVETDRLLRKMEEEVNLMVGPNWAGNQAQLFHGRMTEHLDHLTQIQLRTKNLAESSMQYIQAHQNLDG